MTIAAGFKVQDGILLCADTQYTGAMKVQQQKIFPITIAGEPYAFAIAGNEVYGKMAIQECQEAIADLPVENRTERAVRRSLAHVVKTFNEEYIDTRPETEREGARFDLLVAAWVPRGGGLNLFSTKGVGLIHEPDYQCIGTGDYLAHYLIRPVFHRMMLIREVVLLAIQMLASCKTYDAYCGGFSQLIVLGVDGKLTPVEHFEVSQSEGRIENYDRETRQLLFSLSDPAMDDSGFQGRLDRFIEQVQMLRASWRGKGFEYIIQKLSPSQAVDPESPQPPTHDPSGQPPSPE